MPDECRMFQFFSLTVQNGSFVARTQPALLHSTGDSMKFVGLGERGA